MIDKVFKDSIGQDVKVGDNIITTYTFCGAIRFSKKTITGFTETGRARTGKSSSKNFVKIFEQ